MLGGEAEGEGGGERRCLLVQVELSRYERQEPSGCQEERLLKVARWCVTASHASETAKQAYARRVVVVITGWQRRMAGRLEGWFRNGPCLNGDATEINLVVEFYNGMNIVRGWRRRAVEGMLTGTAGRARRSPEYADTRWFNSPSERTTRRRHSHVVAVQYVERVLSVLVPVQRMSR